MRQQIEKDKQEFFDKLRVAEKEKNPKEQKAVIISAIKFLLPGVEKCHRQEFAKQFAGESCDATTASLGYAALTLMGTFSASSEEKRLLNMVISLCE